jgi:glutamate-1-semialdehyde aminotransferase
MGNGLPISAVAGKKEIMELIGTQGVFISTTFGGEALSLAGALATINILEQPGTYEYIWRLGGMMLDGLRSLIVENKLEEVVMVSGLPPHGGLVFEGKGRLDYLDTTSVFQQKMIRKGILTLGINNICLSHTEKEIDTFLNAVDEAMKEIKNATEHDSLNGVLTGGKVNPIFKRNIH